MTMESCPEVGVGSASEQPTPKRGSHGPLGPKAE